MGMRLGGVLLAVALAMGACGGDSGDDSAVDVATMDDAVKAAAVTIEGVYDSVVADLIRKACDGSDDKERFDDARDAVGAYGLARDVTDLIEGVERGAEVYCPGALIEAARSTTTRARARARISSTTTVPIDTDGDGTLDRIDAYPDNPLYSEALTVTVACSRFGDEFEREFEIDRVTLDFSEAWSTEMPVGDDHDYSLCGYGRQDPEVSPVTELEREIVETYSEYPLSQSRIIGDLFAFCVEHGTKWMTQRTPLSEGQAETLVRAFRFCPGHPDRAGIEPRIAQMGVEGAERSSGTRFGSGIYRVGIDIQPGSYVSESESGFDGCYWERVDANGEIIDNYFGSPFRVTVTIASSDYSFRTDGCGEWSRS